MSSNNDEKCFSNTKEAIYPDLEPPQKNQTSTKFMDTYVEDMAKVIKAADFAARRHRFQKRKDARQTPYINHCIGKINFYF